MDTVWNIQDILRLLPHRFPFLLVDRVLSLQQPNNSSSRVGAKITVLKNVTVNEPYFTGHFPGLPVMPGVLQIEAMAQAACLAFVRQGEPENDYFIAAINEAKFRRVVTPGDTLIMTAEIMKDRGSMILVKTEARVEGQVVCEAEILAKVLPKTARVPEVKA
jgi:3-hydroxyacyl-[acyl-carrier-protein] dehydratase